MNEYYTIYSTTHGIKFFKTRKAAIDHMQAANDHFEGGVTFHKEDMDGKSLLSVDQMTPAQQAKSMGLKSLTEVSQITGVSLNTLTNWHRDKRELFRIVLIGCVADIAEVPLAEKKH